ncbi:unnamed protein product, partial [Closterium sp. Naga37s-1]
CHAILNASNLSTLSCSPLLRPIVPMPLPRVRMPRADLPLSTMPTLSTCRCSPSTPWLSRGMQKVGEAVGTVITSAAGIDQLEMRVRALALQLEEAERRLGAEMKEHREAMMQCKAEVELRLSEGDRKRAWE